MTVVQNDVRTHLTTAIIRVRVTQEYIIYLCETSDATIPQLHRRHPKVAQDIVKKVKAKNVYVSNISL